MESKRRRQFSDAERQELIRDFRSSGESIAAYSARRGIGKGNLSRWLRQAPSTGGNGGKRSAFAAVQVVEAAEAAKADAGRVVCELKAASGVQVRVYQGCDDRTLRVMVEAACGAVRC